MRISPTDRAKDRPLTAKLVAETAREVGIDDAAAGGGFILSTGTKNE